MDNNNQEPASPIRGANPQQENFETPERQIRRQPPEQPPQLPPRGGDIQRNPGPLPAHILLVFANRPNRRGEAGQQVDLITGANVVTPERNSSHAENVQESRRQQANNAAQR